MALADLLYRCPECGHDPVMGVGDEARCGACGRHFGRADARGRIRVTDPDGSSRSRSAAELTRAIAGHGGPLTAASQPGGSILYRAEALMRQSTSEAPVYFRKRLLGFAESYGGSRSGVLEASDDVLRFREGDGPVFDWGLLDIRALQTSSSTVQITPRHGAMAQFRFVSDSPRRWEELICHLLSEAWLRAGRGRIVEFQPRIVVR